MSVSDSTQNKIVFQRRYLPDDELPEGRVSVPFSLVMSIDASGQTATIDAANYPSVRNFTNFKSIIMNVAWDTPAANSAPSFITVFCPDSGHIYTLNPRIFATPTQVVSDQFILPLITNQSRVVFGCSGPAGSFGSIITINGFINNFEMSPLIS